MKKSFLLLLVLLAVAVTAAAQEPKREFRSVWLTTYQLIDWPSSSARGNEEKCKAELLEYLDNHEKRNYTGVCLHVRTWADAVYKSSYEPWSEWVSGTRGKDPGWDPLAFAVEECHKRGLECYAWVNPFRFSRNWQARTTPQDLEVLSKGWIIDNGTTTQHNEYQIFNPALPEVREYLYGIMKEIYTNYRIDGFLFDDYFYPNKIPADNTAQDYADFQEQNPGVSGTKENINNWRRGNINLFMRELYAMVQKDRPDIRFGLSPAGVAKEGCANIEGLDPVPFGTDWQYDDICSDPVAWLADGSCDFISPQIYWFARSDSHSYTTAAPYTELCEWWSNTAARFGRHFYSSMAPSRMGEGTGYNNEHHWSDLSYQIELNRRFTGNDAPGAIMYSAKYMDGPLLSGWGAYLQEHSFSRKSLVPLVDWKQHAAPETPLVIREGNVLDWTTEDPAPTGNDPVRRYTVYAVPTRISKERATTPEGDGLSTEYLLKVSYDQTFEIPANYRSGYWFAVCSYNGYGYESEPALIDYPGEFPPPPVTPSESTAYPEISGAKLQNLWFRSVLSPFENIEFEANGKRNRGMVIADGKVLLSGRTDDSKGPSYVRVYDLITGEFVREAKVSIPSDVTYPCNDIVRDNEGNVYITNLTINSNGTPLSIYRLDTATFKTELFAELKTELSTRPRIDHCSVYSDPAKAGRYYVFAAVASSNTIVRWTVENGQATAFESRKVAGFVPAASKNFGVAPKAFALDADRVVVDGGSTYPTEYSFASGAILGSFDGNLAPAGAQANGFAHFGPECYMAYAATDHESPAGYKFNIVGADGHGLSTASHMWQVPGINMGTQNSTSLSAPVDAVTDTQNNGWTAYVAVYAPGNSLAVYTLSHTTTGVEIDGEVATPGFVREAGRIVFDGEAEGAALYDTTGRVVAVASGSVIELPETAGIYILRYGSVAEKIYVR